MAIVITAVCFTVAKLSIMPIRLKGELGNVRCLCHRAASPMAAYAAPSLRRDCGCSSDLWDHQIDQSRVSLLV